MGIRARISNGRGWLVLRSVCPQSGYGIISPSAGTGQMNFL